MGHFNDPDRPMSQCLLEERLHVVSRFSHRAGLPLPMYAIIIPIEIYLIPVPAL